jgi:hypothetical protein
MSSVCDSQYPPRRFVERASQNRRNASSSISSVPPHIKWLLQATSKSNSGFSFSEPSVSSEIVDIIFE